MNTKGALATIFLICTFFFLPFFFSPSLLTERNNDLGRNYIPLFNFIRESFYTYHQFPLWNPNQLMGETFALNPLSSLFYPANIIFLIIPPDFSFVVYIYLHILLAAIFTYFLSRSFNFSNESSLLASLFYAFAVKNLLHLQAGHITMVASFAFFPLAFLSTRKILTTNKFLPVVTLSASLSVMYFLYPTIAFYTLAFIAAYVIYKLLNPLNLKILKITFLRFLLAALITFALSAIALFAHLEFSKLSTRANLTLEDVAIPLWNLPLFAKSILFPYPMLKSLDHEAFLYLGVVPILLSIAGFLKLEKLQKITIFIGVVFALLFAAGLSTPIFPIAYKYVPLLDISRVTTRFWFIIAMLAALMSAYAAQYFKNIKIIYVLVFIFLIESWYIFFLRQFALPKLNFGNIALYEKIAQDNGVFRIYCSSYCFNPQLVLKYKIQTLHGESPIQNQAFVDFLQKAGNYQHNRFAVIFPPYQVWQVEKPPTPNSKILAEANVKYIASTYEITDKNYNLLGKFQNVYLYENKNFKQLAYFEDSDEKVQITKKTPNNLSLNFAKSQIPRNLIIAQNYYPGWIAKMDSQIYPVKNYNNTFQVVTVMPNVDSAQISYMPKSLAKGATITLATALFLVGYFWYIRKRKNHG